jgi:hypothetical protein
VVETVHNGYLKARMLVDTIFLDFFTQKHRQFLQIPQAKINTIWVMLGPILENLPHNNVFPTLLSI